MCKRPAIFLSFFVLLMGLFSSGAHACTPTAVVSSCGSIIIDNTPRPGEPGLVTNMSTNIGGKEFGASNSFNIGGIQVMQRRGDDSETDLMTLVDEIGISNSNSTSYERFGTGGQLNFFADGQHLFDLDRFRAAADALRSFTFNAVTGAITGSTTDWTVNDVRININPTTSHPAGTYGSITWREFIDNVAAVRSMYGIVRIKIPIQLTGSTGRNANDFENRGPHTPLYGFCRTAVGLCSQVCVGGSCGMDIEPTKTVAGVTIPNNGQIRVYGALVYDFVDNRTGDPVGLVNLPWDPRAIYFKVKVPISVNPANDSNNDGVMDNIDYISGLTASKACAAPSCSLTITDTILFNQVPAEARAAYQFQFGGEVLDQTEFDGLSQPNKYHLLMPSGYPDGWLRAFVELGITARMWKALSFDVPAATALDGILTINQIRSHDFEDIPSYIYTGGLIDMHHHTNISGLVYVPQAMELEQKQSTSRQYIMGAVVVRDGFYLEGKPGGVTLISSDPSSVASIKVLVNRARPPKFSEKKPARGGSDREPIVGDPGSGTWDGGGGGGDPPGVGTQQWVEIRPR